METEGFLLGGRVRHNQLASGHRTGIEPVLLAASVPARAGAGERVLEAGTGSGACLLCLAWRVAGLSGLGVERDAGLAALAERNMAANGFVDMAVMAGAIGCVTLDARFDHALANPPWHDARGTPSEQSSRELARRAAPGLIAQWAAAMSAALRPRGTLTMIVASAVLPDVLAAFGPAGCGSPAIFPLWPKVGTAAKLVLLRAVKGGRGPCQLLPGLTLHEADGRFTPAADAILRDGAALEF